MISYEDVIKALLLTLRNSDTLDFVLDSAIKIVGNLDSNEEKLKISDFTDFGIVLHPPPSNYYRDERRLGGLFDKYYSCDIILMIKSGEIDEDKLFSSDGIKGIFEFQENVKSVLNGNTLGGVLDTSSFSEIGDPLDLGKNGNVQTVRLPWTGHKREL